MNYFRNLVGTSLLLTLSVSANGDEDASRPLLNSERIEQSFGSYGVHIVTQSPAFRATCLYSGAGGDRVCRTLAVVRFAQDSDPRLATSLDRIRQGASLGSTLLDAGWQVEKTRGEIGQLTSSVSGHEDLSRFLGLADPVPLAFHIYALQAVRDELRVPVAELFELHHPAYLTEAELRRIYGIDGGTPKVTGQEPGIGDWLSDVRAAFRGDAPFN